MSEHTSQAVLNMKLLYIKSFK